MSDAIYVYIDHDRGQAPATTWEALGAAHAIKKQIDGVIHAVVVGQGVDSLADQAIALGADQVHIAQDPALEHFRVEQYVDVLSGLVQDAAMVLMPDSPRTRDLAGMLAVDLDAAALTDVTELEVDSEGLLATRPIYAGKLLSKARPRTDRVPIVTLRSRAFSAPVEMSDAQGRIETVQVAPGEPKTEVVEYREAQAGVSLTDAAVVVSGGRGLANNPDMEPPADLTDEKEREIWRAQQGFELVRELAKVLGGAVGASRAAVDANYIPYASQVGQTGKVVTPDLYIACGISGAIQHLAGMRTAKTIVAINTDADAPIFKLARFGVIGDVYQILPPLIEALRERVA